jgi:hypothetical protein
MPFASCVSALHLPHLQPGFLQAHLAWSVQQVQTLPLSHAQAASFAQLHLSPQEQVLPATHSHLALQAQPCFSPLHVQHPANTTASATAAIIINFFIFDSFLFVAYCTIQGPPLQGTPHIISHPNERSVIRMSKFCYFENEAKPCISEYRIETTPVPFANLWHLFYR